MPKKELARHLRLPSSHSSHAVPAVQQESLQRQASAALQRVQAGIPYTVQPHDVMALQRTLGNHAVQRMLVPGTTPATPVIQRGKPKKTAAQKEQERKEREKKKKAKAKRKERRRLFLERLKRTRERNTDSKAIPVNDREFLQVQQNHNYGFTNTTIDEGFVQGNFRRGWGNQPFLSLNKDNYGGAVVGSDYDALIQEIESDKHSEESIARDIMKVINKQEYNKKKYSNDMDRTISTFVQLTQVIEPHSSRVPGIDKLARACFRRIAAGESTFRQEFNRENGNFAAAWAKKGGAFTGGQDAARTLFGMDPKKNDKSTLKDVVDDDVVNLDNYLSESSEEEDSESSTSSSSESEEEMSESDSN